MGCEDHATVMRMATLQVKRVPEDLHRALKDRAREYGVSMSDLVVQLLRRELALPSWSQWVAELESSLRDRARAEVDVEALMDEVRGEFEESGGQSAR